MPDIVVIHYTAMNSAIKARDWLCNPDAEVSAHYVISETGTCWQLVDEKMRAWHAGAGAWGAVTDVNSRSIGIELANTGNHPFPEPQMAVLEQLLHGIKRRWAIRPERVIGHSCMAPMRKSDPGARFDWARLASQSLAIKIEAGQIEAGQIEAGTQEPDQTLADQLLQKAGFTADVSPSARVTAFRLRHRQHGQGPLDPYDMALISALATQHPVDAVPLTS